ncbi:hypothetical protein [Secundilactobacillus odoratitofui]|uniref:hypothetical protein n=1 Tax=Secundilactobacillus odoratitofui TaxID=480930 RepID=UPI0006D1D314|nr:hypothetical protein [Secundilactobacillus odoratitofui]
MKLTQQLLVLAAATTLFGTTVVSASAATTDSTTIQALPNQAATKLPMMPSIKMRRLLRRLLLQLTRLQPIVRR